MSGDTESSARAAELPGEVIEPGEPTSEDAGPGALGNGQVRSAERPDEAAEPERREAGTRGPGALPELAGLASVGLALLFYVGYAYAKHLYGYFHLDPLDLGMSVAEFALRSLGLISPGLILAVSMAVTLVAARGVVLGPLARSETARVVRCRAVARGKEPALRLGTGLVLSGAGVALYVLAHRTAVSTPLVVALLAAGPLIAGSRPEGRERDRRLRMTALLLAGVCALWVASLYAADKGEEASRHFAEHLVEQPAAVVYSTERLRILGPGVKSIKLKGAGPYGFRYTGLRLLTMRGDRYYLLPVGWRRTESPVYILEETDDLRVEIYAGTR